MNTRDRALPGVVEDGAYGVVVGNRFPAVDPAGAAPVGNLVHLVSLEGWAPWLVDDPVFTRSGTDGGTEYDTVALLSLASWTFQAVADPAENFAGLALDLLAGEYDASTGDHHPPNLWLRLPPPDLDPAVGANAEVVDRITAGYVPVPYHARSGEDTVGWYRGPENIARLIDTRCPARGPGDMRLVPTRANGQHAFGLYMRDGDTYRPFNLPVLSLTPDGVSHVTAFFDTRLFATFGLPASLPVDRDAG